MPYHLQLNRIIQYVNDHCLIGPRGLPCGDTLSGNEVDILKQGLQVCCNPDECFLFFSPSPDFVLSISASLSWSRLPQKLPHIQLLGVCQDHEEA
jgi:hypothetical protein